MTTEELIRQFNILGAADFVAKDCAKICLDYAMFNVVQMDISDTMKHVEIEKLTEIKSKI